MKKKILLGISSMCCIVLISGLSWFLLFERREPPVLRFAVSGSTAMFLFELSQEGVLTGTRGWRMWEFDVRRHNFDRIVEGPYEIKLSEEEFQRIIGLADEIDAKLEEVGFNTLHRHSRNADGGNGIYLYYNGRVFETMASQLVIDLESLMRLIEWVDELVYDGDFSERPLIKELIHTIVGFFPDMFDRERLPWLSRYFPPWLFEGDWQP